jgi:hypothetical protein
MPTNNDIVCRTTTWSCPLNSIISSVAAAAADDDDDDDPNDTIGYHQYPAPFVSTWAHAVNSIAALRIAMDQANNNITSIECDVMIMSRDVDKADCEDEKVPLGIIPILSHPPHRTSDLTLERMLNTVTKEKEEGEELTTTTASLPFDQEQPLQSQRRPKRNLIRNLKLDFKELPALIPSLDLLDQVNIYNPFQKCIILNADILPGPGKRDASYSSCASCMGVAMPADTFLSTCLDFIEMQQLKHPDRALQFVLSLGYQCDWQEEGGYLPRDAAAMKELIEKYHLFGGNDGSIVGVRVVLALNARLLAKNLSIFDSLLLEYDTLGILAWTGSGEPPIPLEEVETIQKYYVEKDDDDDIMMMISNRIEYDCCIDCC